MRSFRFHIANLVLKMFLIFLGIRVERIRQVLRHDNFIFKL